AVYAIVIAWVLRSDEVFEAITDEMAEAHVTRAAKRTTQYQARSVGWSLPLTGRTEMAFVWKGALQTFRIVGIRVLIRLALIVAWLISAVALFGRARGLAQALGLLAAFGAAFVSL